MREDRPPTKTQPVAATESTRRWVPPSSVRGINQSTEQKNDNIFRLVRGILNKLTPDKFDKLSLELLNVGIDSQVVLKGIILLIFDKALDEPKYSSLYAQLCKRLCEDAPNFETDLGKSTTFKRLLLNKCRDEFENRSRATEAFYKQTQLTTDEEEQLHIAKHKMLGNIRFIGELGKLQMLHEKILHECIKKLLGAKKKVNIKDMAEDYECLCQILKTVGPRLDTPQAKLLMDQYFMRIATYKDNPELPSRVKFMLQDVIELRQNKWIPRHVNKEVGPKTILQVRQEAAKDLGVFFSPPGTGPGHHGMGIGSSSAIYSPGNGMMNNSTRLNTVGPMSDMFGPVPTGFIGDDIGTGPGVIPMEGFNISYTNNMNRLQNENAGPFSFSSRRIERESPPLSGGNKSRGSNRGQVNRDNKEQANRNLPPRFQRKLNSESSLSPPAGSIQNGHSRNYSSSTPNAEEISLRPSRNSFNPVLKPSTLGMLPKSAMMPSSAQEPPLSKPKMTKQPQINLQQVATQEKPRSNKKSSKMSLNEIEEAAVSILNVLIETSDLKKAQTELKNLKVPKRLIPRLLSILMKESLDKNEEDCTNLHLLFFNMKNDNTITSEQFIEGYVSLIDKISSLEIKTPLIRSHAAMFAAHAVVNGTLTLSELSVPMRSGAYYPLFLLSLQRIAKLKDNDWLVQTFNESKIQLQDILPECDRDRMMEILEERGLGFIFPLLRLQIDLSRQIQSESNPNNLYKWVKDNVNQKLFNDPGFINILNTCILKDIMSKTSLSEGCDKSVQPNKEIINEEKNLLNKFKNVLGAFLRDNLDLQVIAIYAMQVFCFERDFPRGMLLRLFRNMYDFGIIEEEAFLRWKEEVNSEYPGKGDALFQVNSWLTWLEQAEEESDEGAD